MYASPGILLTSCRDFLPCSCNTNDDTLSPTLVASFECCSHDTNVSSAVESIITSTIRHLNQLFLDSLVLKLRWVDEIGCAEFLCPRLFIGIYINHDDLSGLSLHSSLNN